jgi:DNA-directed RNA polymerase subunit N (RpoN/RPB10)
MFPYVVCPSCGWCIGQVTPLFEAMREEAQAAALAARGLDIDTVNHNMVSSNDGVGIELGPILDRLGVRLECCRTKLITQVGFYTVY